MKGRLSHNHQLLSSFCQLISFPHFDTQSIDAHLSNFENLPQKWNLSSWRLIILLLSKESKVVTFTRNCLQTPSHMLKLQAMHSPLDFCGRTPLSRITFTLSQQLKSSQNKIFSAEKWKTLTHWACTQYRLPAFCIWTDTFTKLMLFMGCKSNCETHFSHKAMLSTVATEWQAGSLIAISSSDFNQPLLH